MEWLKKIEAALKLDPTESQRRFLEGCRYWIGINDFVYPTTRQAERINWICYAIEKKAAKRKITDRQKAEAEALEACGAL